MEGDSYRSTLHLLLMSPHERDECRMLPYQLHMVHLPLHPAEAWATVTMGPLLLQWRVLSRQLFLVLDYDSSSAGSTGQENDHRQFVGIAVPVILKTTFCCDQNKRHLRLLRPLLREGRKKGDRGERSPMKLDELRSLVFPNNMWYRMWDGTLQKSKIPLSER